MNRWPEVERSVRRFYLGVVIANGVALLLAIWVPGWIAKLGSEKREPGGASRAGPRPVVLGERTAHNILVDLDTEYKGELLSDPPATKSRVPVLHLNDGSDQLGIRPFRTWFSSALRREQQSVLALHEGSMETHDRGRPERDGRAQQAGRAYQFGANACNHSVDGSKIRCSLPRAIENHQLVFEQERLGDNGTSAATSKESGDRGDEMDEKDRQIAHPDMVPISTNVTRLGTL